MNIDINDHGMKYKSKIIGVLIFTSLLFAKSGGTKEVTGYLFVNSDNKKQQELVESINLLLFEEKIRLANKTLVVVDLANKKKEFKGEFIYLSNDDFDFSLWMRPRVIPEYFEVENSKVINRQAIDINSVNSNVIKLLTR
ncbi:hypothetical protein [Dongshaea marina]|uniref:hypothetical protein n=1 Tax=Dongshaea marina TaxID=2047966 RepID=UPI000D3ECD4F|nr:hypothetical protein [Dongshaea marina]